MSTVNVHCPSCYSKELRIVGCYVYTLQGAPYTDTFSFLDLKNSDAFESQKMLRCDTCQKHTTLSDASAAGVLVEDVIRWESAITGRRVPLVCPVCKNKKLFLQEQLQLLEQTHMVEIDAAGVLQQVELLTDDSRESVVLRYRCAVEGCEGSVQVNDDTFRVTPL